MMYPNPYRLSMFVNVFRLVASAAFLTLGAGIAVITAFEDAFLGFYHVTPTWFIQNYYSGTLEAVGELTLLNIPVKLIIALALLLTGVKLIPHGSES